MFAKLEQVERKYLQLTDQLSSGTLTPKEMQKIAKEQSSLKELVEVYQAYCKAVGELESNKKMLLNESSADMKDLIKEEILELESNIQNFETTLKILLLPKSPNDEKNIMLEIRAGTGGEEAALFAANLLQMYLKYAENQGWKTEIISSNETGRNGFKEVILAISGNKVYSKLKFESGTHRVQRVPTTESSGRIHTSAVTVAVLPEADEIELTIPETDLKIDKMRAGGAGGQHVNTTDSAIRITHLPTNTVVICQDERSQHKNKAKAMKILRARLLDKMENDQQQEEAQKRKSMVGSGDRSEKIRTYNFPQSRVTDHRIGLTIHQLDEVLNGQLNPLIDPIISYTQAELLKESTMNDS